MPPRGSKFFQFHAVFGKFWRNRMLAPPPRRNPGSATVLYNFMFFDNFLIMLIPCVSSVVVQCHFEIMYWLFIYD